MSRRTRVLLLIPHLGGGGAEQVMALLAKGLSRDRFEVHLGVVTETNSPTELSALGVTVHSLGAKRVRDAALPLLQLVWSLHPTVILSGMYHLNFLVLLLRSLFPRPRRIIVRQNATISLALGSGWVAFPTRFLYRKLYRKADRIICQTRAMANDLCLQLQMDSGKIRVAHNPIDFDGLLASSKTGSNLWRPLEPRLIAVGRLSAEKGLDLLLDAMVPVVARFPDAILKILGKGPEEAKLKVLCRELGLEASIEFEGYVERPSMYFAGASLFVLASRHEGLPNALLEAAACGLPIVTTPACEGLVDLVREQPGVWLTEEISAEAIASSLVNALTALQGQQRFEHRFVEDFRMESAIAEYEQVIDELMGEPTD